MSITARISMGLTLLLIGCHDSGVPKRVNTDDPRLLPFLEALSRVDRAAMGFSSQPIAGDIRIESVRQTGGAYDAMLHIANTPTVGRTIAFRMVGDTYTWINEQEQHIGPRMYKDADGVPIHETLFIIRQTEPLTGVAVNQTVIQYDGEDPRLANRPLTLDYVRPILTEWETSQRIPK